MVVTNVAATFSSAIMMRFNTPASSTTRMDVARRISPRRMTKSRFISVRVSFPYSPGPFPHNQTV